MLDRQAFRSAFVIAAIAVGAGALALMSVGGEVAPVPAAHAQEVVQYPVWDRDSLPVASFTYGSVHPMFLFFIQDYHGFEGQVPVFGSLPPGLINRYIVPVAEQAAWGGVLTAERDLVITTPAHTPRIDLLNNSGAAAVRPVNSTWAGVLAYPYHIAADEDETPTFVDNTNSSHYIVGGPNATNYIQGPGGSRGGVAWEAHVPAGGHATAPSDLATGQHWYECLTHGESGVITIVN